MSTVLVAPVLLPVAVVVVVGLVALLARPLVAPAVAGLERARFRRCLAHAARGDAHLKAQQLPAALSAFEAAFCVLTVRADTRLPDLIARHNNGLLSGLHLVATVTSMHCVR